jgi:L-arabinose isomerase
MNVSANKGTGSSAAHGASGLRKCLNGWLTAGGPHHEVMNLGHHAADWKVFCQLTGIEFVQV